MRGTASLWLVLLASIGLIACERETTPPLISVSGVSPREVEEGDRLIITGAGFPEGKIAHVTFHGDLHRPGEPAVTDVDVSVNAAVSGPGAVDVPWTESLETLFVGSGEHATHTTFTGDITVAFAALGPAAPPVAGTLRDTWLDVSAPHLRAFRPDAREAERTLAFLGIGVAAAPVPAGGLLVESIAPGSRADAARLLPGDVLTEIDGLRIRTVHDAVVPPGARAAWLKIRRGGSPDDEPACLSLLGLSAAPGSLLLGPVVLLSVALFAVLFLFAPTSNLAAWFEGHAYRRILGARSRDDLVGSLLHPLSTMAGGSARGVGLALFASSVVALLPLAHLLGAGDVDASSLFLLSLSALSLVALCAGGAPRVSVGAGVVASVRVLSLAIPVGFSVVAGVIATGSLRLDDLVRAQGGYPWAWGAFRTPMGLGLFALSYVSLLAASDAPDATIPESDIAPVRPKTIDSARARLFTLARATFVLLACAILAAVFLGGWQLPGLAPEQMEGHGTDAAAGALVYIGKTWSLAGGVALGRRLLPRVDGERALPLAWRWLAPTSALLVGATAAWTSVNPGPRVELVVGAVLLALTSGALMRFVFHLWRPGPVPELDPFV